MLAYTFYESDNRVRRYAETLVKRGDDVDVLALKRKNQCSFDIVHGVNVFRIQKRVKNEKNKITHLFRLLVFLFKTFIFLSYKHIKKPYDLIHVHSVPDFEVFAALIPKIFGAKVILDIHDIIPEFYESKFDSNKKSFMFKFLVLTEKVSILFSDHVIISNHIWYKTLISRSTNGKKCTTIMNYPDNSIFYKRDLIRNEKKFTILYPGTLNWHQGLDIAIKAFALLKNQAPVAEFHIYGEGPAKNDLISLINKLGLDNRVFLKESVPINEIAVIMANSNLGVIPKRNDCFGGEAFSTKTLEFISLGVPIIVSKTKIDQYYFNESIVKFFEPGNEKDLAEAMLLLINDKEMRDELVQNALRFIKKNNWEEKKAYLSQPCRLVMKPPLKYVLVSPAHNEEANIEKTIKSVISQTVKPEKWVIVSDGSMDRTDAIVNRYLPENAWVELVRLPEHRDRQFAAKVQAFNAGYEKVKELDYDIIGNLDADISFEEDYFQFLIGKFGENPELGVAGTPFLEGGKHYDYRFTNVEHVSGACQMFRRKCFEEIGGYLPIKGGGIDWVAVTTARMKGWQTRTFTEKTCQHHRKMGTGNTSAILTWFRQGQKDYFLGNHPFWEVFRTFYQMTKKPFFVGGFILFFGFAWAALKRIKRPISKELMDFIREEQMQRLKKILKLA